MRKPWVLGLTVVLLAANLSATTPEKTKTHGFSVSGTVGRIDEAAKTFVVRTSAGKETTLVRTTATKVNGESLKSGDRVAVRYLERDGKKVATSIRVEPPAVAAATPTAPAPSTR
jgi:ribosomal protein L16/L10AE